MPEEHGALPITRALERCARICQEMSERLGGLRRYSMRISDSALNVHSFTIIFLRMADSDFIARRARSRKAYHGFSSHIRVRIREGGSEIREGNSIDPLGISTKTRPWRGPCTPSHQFLPNVCPTTTHTHCTIA